MKNSKISKKLILQHKPIFDEYDAKAVKNVIKSGWVSEGLETKKFEENYRKYIGTKYAIATSSGTAAIFLSLLGSGVKPRDEVIVPNITFIATANAVVLAGAKPVFAEINGDNFTISLESIKRKITNKTSAIIPVHLNGRTTELNELIEVAEKFNLRIVEDASQALGSKYEKKFLGSIGNVAAFSLAPTKVITTGQGGIVTTNDIKIFEKIKKIKDQGRQDKSENYKIVGYNFKYTDLQAALGNSQFSKLKSRLKWLNKLYALYYDLLKKNESIIIPPKKKENQLWYFDIITKKRNMLQKYLQKHKIIARPFHNPINSRKPYLTKEKFPISHKISSIGLYLPSHSDLKIEEIEYISKKINSFFINQ